MSVRITLVGCGAVAQRLYQKPLRTLEQQGLLSVSKLVDSHLPNAESMQRVFRAAKTYTDLDEALTAGDSQLVLVLSPAHLHASHAILALQHGNHVLCEKPMATTAAQGADMISAARAADRILAVGMIRRFFPSYARLRELIVSNELGRIKSFAYQEGRKFDWEVTTPAGFRRKDQGGAGVFFDIGPHAIDVLTWLFGTPEVTGYSDDALAGVEANVTMELDTPACPGTVQLSWDFALANELRVYGDKGQAVLRLDQFDKLAVKTTAGFQEIAVAQQFAADLHQPCRKTLSPKLYTQSMFCQLVQVLRAIHLGEAPAVSAEEGLACVAVIENARGLARPMEMAWLEPDQQEAYRALHWSNA